MIKTESSNNSANAPHIPANNENEAKEVAHSELQDDKKVGVTHAIRQRLNFTDERLWKRFSARRLELIDTMELLSKKASEQEDEIKEVADSLRREFEYPDEYFGDFDKLVRAAVQSVRRNRKRSSNSRRKDKTGAKHENDYIDDDSQIQHHHKKQKLATNGNYNGTPETSGPETAIAPNAGAFASSTTTDTGTVPESSSEYAQSSSFISEIARINTDSHNVIYDMNYSKSKHFSPQDRSRAIMDSMIRPRVGVPTTFIPTNSAPRGPATSATNPDSSTGPGSSLAANGSNMLASTSSQITRVGHLLPPLANVRLTELPEPNAPKAGNVVGVRGSKSSTISPTTTFIPQTPYVDVTAARRTLQRYMEASKTCSEDRGDNANIRSLGKSCLESGIAYLFAHLFQHVDGSLIEYLRGKLTLSASCEKLLRAMDPLIVSSLGKQDSETVILALHRIIGCCVKDFGFEKILMPLCELVYGLITEDYTAILKNSIPFKATEQLEMTKEAVVGNIASIVDATRDGVRSVSSMSGTSNISDVPPAIGTVKKDVRGDSGGLNSLAAIATEQMKLEVNGGTRYPFANTNNGGSVGSENSFPKSLLVSRSTSPLMHPIVSERNDVNMGPLTSGFNGYGPFPPKKKKVILRFLHRVIELEFPMKNAAPPRLGELIENARTAFNLTYMMSNAIWGVKTPDGQIITGDFELEKLFCNDNLPRIELEIFNQGSKAIPIYEITRTISSNANVNSPAKVGAGGGGGAPSNAPSTSGTSGGGSSGGRKDDSPRYILPPPIASQHSHHHHHHLYPSATYGTPQPPPLHPLAHTTNGNGASFIGDDRGKPPPPPPLLPRFQRLL